VIFGPAGNLYGACQGDTGGGAVYELDAAGQFTVLYAFMGGADGGGARRGELRPGRKALRHRIWRRERI
jgi:uncharacterized repeat protein (TIGR03803 family)